MGLKMLQHGKNENNELVDGFDFSFFSFLIVPVHELQQTPFFDFFLPFSLTFVAIIVKKRLAKTSTQ